MNSEKNSLIEASTNFAKSALENNVDHLVIYTDGACSHNGVGGWAYIILGNVNKEESGGEFSTTNNRMELLAVINGIKACEINNGQIEIRTDSQYVKNGICEYIKRWKENGWITSRGNPVKNKDLWIELDKLVTAAKITFTWIKGHTGNIYNDRCDMLAYRELLKLTHRHCYDSRSQKRACEEAELNEEGSK